MPPSFSSKATTVHSVNEAIDSVIFLSKMSDVQISDRLFSGSHDQNRDGRYVIPYFSDKINSIEQFKSVRAVVQDTMTERYQLSVDDKKIAKQFWPGSSLFSVDLPYKGFD